MMDGVTVSLILGFLASQGGLYAFLFRIWGKINYLEGCMTSRGNPSYSEWKNANKNQKIGDEE